MQGCSQLISLTKSHIYSTAQYIKIEYLMEIVFVHLFPSIYVTWALLIMCLLRDYSICPAVQCVLKILRQRILK